MSATSSQFYFTDAQDINRKAGLGLGPDCLGQSPERVEEKSSAFISTSFGILYRAHRHPRPVTNVVDANWYVLLPFCEICRSSVGTEVVIGSSYTRSMIEPDSPGACCQLDLLVTRRDPARLVSDLMHMHSPMPLPV